LLSQNGAKCDFFFRLQEAESKAARLINAAADSTASHDREDRKCLPRTDAELVGLNAGFAFIISYQYAYLPGYMFTRVVLGYGDPRDHEPGSFPCRHPKKIFRTRMVSDRPSCWFGLESLDAPGNQPCYLTHFNDWHYVEILILFSIICRKHH
jgi:hypothetical protein